MSALTQEKWISEEEYWAMVEKSPQKLEWYNGRVVPLFRGAEAMAGGGYIHARLIVRLNAVLERALEGKRCTATGSELHVQAGENGLKTLPDNAIHCEDARFDGKNRNILLNPKVIFEVLSPGTEKYDRTEKFDHYKRIESLTDYLLVWQDMVRVEKFSRAENGWVLQVFHRLSDMVSLPSVEIEIALGELYRGLEMPEQLALWSGQTGAFETENDD